MSINRPNGPSIDIRPVRSYDEPALRTFLATLGPGLHDPAVPVHLVSRQRWRGRSPTPTAGAVGRRGPRRRRDDRRAGRLGPNAPRRRARRDRRGRPAGGHRGVGLEDAMLAALDAGAMAA